MNESDALFFMSNLSPRQTGLPYVVWCAQNGGFEHDACVWVSSSFVPSKLVRVAIRPDIYVAHGKMTAGDFGLLREWITLNLDVLIRHWDGEIESSADAIAAIRPIQAQPDTESEE